MGRLDRATLLKRRELAAVRLYKQAGMAYVVKPRVNTGRGVPTQRNDRQNNQRSAGRRNRRNLILLARSNQPSHFVTLTFATRTDPKTANVAWSELVGRWRKKIKGFYVRVGEISEKHNLHFHVLCDESVSNYLAEHWSHGLVKATRIPFSDLEQVSNYMSKDFGNPERPFVRRYVASKGAKPKFQELHFETMDEAVMGVAELSPVPFSMLGISINTNRFGEFGEVKWAPEFDV